MSLSEKEKFNLIKPLPDGWPKDEKGTPYLKMNHCLKLLIGIRLNMHLFQI